MEKNELVYELTPARKKKIARRLEELLAKAKRAGHQGEQAESVAMSLAFMAIDNCAKSAYHMGKNDQQTRYNDLIKNIFGSQELMERWLAK